MCGLNLEGAPQHQERSWAQRRALLSSSKIKLDASLLMFGLTIIKATIQSYCWNLFLPVSVDMLESPGIDVAMLLHQDAYRLYLPVSIEWCCRRHPHQHRHRHRHRQHSYDSNP